MQIWENNAEIGDTIKLNLLSPVAHPGCLTGWPFQPVSARLPDSPARSPPHPPLHFTLQNYGQCIPSRKYHTGHQNSSRVSGRPSLKANYHHAVFQAGPVGRRLAEIPLVSPASKQPKMANLYLFPNWEMYWSGSRYVIADSVVQYNLFFSFLFIFSFILLIYKDYLKLNYKYKHKLKLKKFK